MGTLPLPPSPVVWHYGYQIRVKWYAEFISEESMVFFSPSTLNVVLDVILTLVYRY